MSIQDKIFNVRNQLDEHDENLDDFDDIVTYLDKLEKAYEDQGKTITDIQNGFAALDKLTMRNL